MNLEKFLFLVEGEDLSTGVLKKKLNMWFQPLESLFFLYVHEKKGPQTMVELS